MAIVDQALKGRVALVTGGSRGIGRAIAIALGKRGAKVIVNFASREDAARETAEAVKAAGGDAVTLGFDVAASAAVSDAIKSIGKDHGGLDILVNNAGVAVNGLLMRFTDDAWAKSIQTNLSGAFHCTRAAATFLLKSRDNSLWSQPEAWGLKAIAEGFRHLGFRDPHLVGAAPDGESCTRLGRSAGADRARCRPCHSK
jgi:3-oxoacyl-[acyl-carrier protein] reductase